LRAETPIFEDMRDVLEQQFGRLSPLEREVLVWLALAREAVSLRTLQGNFVYPASTGAVLEAVRSLQRRSLLETCGDRIALPHVVTAYVTERLRAQVCREVEGAGLPGGGGRRSAGRWRAQVCREVEGAG